MKTIYLFILALSFSLNAQTFSFSTKEYKNALEGPMNGVPGNVFSTMITFTNSSSSPIYINIERYKNDHPPYWAICYCYFQCQSPYQDTLTVRVEAMATNFAVVQFKTDSVNPGIAHNSFNIYQTGFESNIKKLDMTASTLNDVGVKKQEPSQGIAIYPNPATNLLYISAGGESIRELKVFDALGSLKFRTESAGANSSIDVSTFPKGIYFVEIATDKVTYSRKVVKN